MRLSCVFSLAASTCPGCDAPAQRGLPLQTWLLFALTGCCAVPEAAEGRPTSGVDGPLEELQDHRPPGFAGSDPLRPLAVS